MNEREKEKLHALHYFHKRKRSTLEHRMRVAERRDKEEARAREKRIREREENEHKEENRTERTEQDRARNIKLAYELMKAWARNKEEERKRFLSGGVFFTFPGAALLYEDEEEARKSGGDAVRRFDNTADAVRYAKTGE